MGHDSRGTHYIRTAPLRYVGERGGDLESNEKGNIALFKWPKSIIFPFFPGDLTLSILKLFN
jgi:hypothetical protein